MTILVDILGLLLLLALSAAGIGLAWLWRLDVNRFRPQLAAKVMQVTGRRLEIAGEIGLKRGLVPVLTLRRVTLANADWSARPVMVRLGEAEAELALLPLLLGEIDIRRFVLRDVDLLLEWAAGGRANWHLAQPAPTAAESPTAVAESASARRESAQAWLPLIRDLTLDRVAIVFRGAGGGETRLAFDRLRAAMESVDGPFTLDGDLRLDEAAIAVKGQAGSLRALLFGRRLPLRLDLASAGSTLSLRGSLEGIAYDAELELATPHLPGLNPIARVSLPRLGPGRLTGKVAGDGAGLAARDVTLRLGGSDLGGSFGIGWSGAKVTIEGDLDGDHVDLNQIIAAFGDPEAPRAPRAAVAADDRVLPATPIPYGWLDAIEGSVKIGVGRLLAGDFPFEDLQIAASLKGGRLRLKPVSAKILDGRFSAEGHWARPGQAIALAATLERLDLGKLLRTLKAGGLMQGRLGLRLDLKGRGATVRELLGSLDGTAEAIMTEGQVGSHYFDLLGGTLMRQMPFFADLQDEARLNCVISAWDLEDGVARARAFVVDAQHMTISADGSIDLKAERLDLLVAPESKAIGLSLGAPMRIKGSLAAPVILPDPAAAARKAAAVGVGLAAGGLGLLMPLVGLGNQAASDAEEAAQRLADPLAKAAGAVVGKGAEAMGDALKGLSHGLKGLFGQ